MERVVYDQLCLGTMLLAILAKLSAIVMLNPDIQQCIIRVFAATAAVPPAGPAIGSFCNTQCQSRHTLSASQKPRCGSDYGLVKYPTHFCAAACPPCT
eukprot:1159088-Pelagomonas_calceolata.AAC.15